MENEKIPMRVWSSIPHIVVEISERWRVMSRLRSSRVSEKPWSSYAHTMAHHPYGSPIRIISSNDLVCSYWYSQISRYVMHQWISVWVPSASSTKNSVSDESMTQMEWYETLWVRW
jgi:hypothetical protein